MRSWLALWLGCVLVLGSGCTGSSTPSAGRAHAAPSSSPAPRVGGPTPTPSAVPTRPMDDVEKPIAHQLRIEVAGQGLTVDYLACPAWDQWVPDRLTCTGYFDGVPAKVRVRLSSTTAGAVTFTAALGAGIIATHNLVRTLERRGYAAVDCGHVAAYPATIGTRVTCSVTRDGRQKYVVATVTSRTGRVMIRDY